MNSAQTTLDLGTDAGRAVHGTVPPLVVRLSDSVTIIRADCRDVLPVDCDAVVTDPPYGAATHKGARSLGIDDDLKGHNAIDFDSVDADFLRGVFGQCHPKRWLVSFIEWRHCLPLEAKPPQGLDFIRFGVWTKLNPMPQLTGDRPGTGWEAVAILHPPGKKRWNGGGTSAVWAHGTSRYGYFGPSAHPTEKPVGLVGKMLLQFTDDGETVCDPFMGSGTTGIACIRTGRKFIGIEKDARYFEIARARLENELRHGLLPLTHNVPVRRSETAPGETNA